MIAPIATAAGKNTPSFQALKRLIYDGKLESRIIGRSRCIFLADALQVLGLDAK
jgi:hypothetical protein